MEGVIAGFFFPDGCGYRRVTVAQLSAIDLMCLDWFREQSPSMFLLTQLIPLKLLICFSE